MDMARWLQKYGPYRVDLIQCIRGVEMVKQSLATLADCTRWLAVLPLLCVSASAIGDSHDDGRVSYSDGCDESALNVRAWNDFEYTEKAPEALGRQIVEFEPQDGTAIAQRRTTIWDGHRTRTRSNEETIPIEFMRVGRVWYWWADPGTYNTTVVFEFEGCKVEVVFPTMTIQHRK